MPNKKYIKGRNHENYIKRKYEQKGFACLRSAASKGPVDVMAIKKGPYCEKEGRHCPILFAIQCKTKNYRLTRADRKKMKEWAEKTGVFVAVE